MVDDCCRLCGGGAKYAFGLRLLDRFDVSYFRCTHCGSLQTERPYWLDVAYTEGDAGEAFDTWAAQRTRYSAAAVLAAYRLARLRKPLLDFGGGTGLLCRTLRDTGLDAWTFDAYADGHYARDFRVHRPSEQSYDLVSAFEVFEHLPDPASALRDFFDTRPKVAVVSTVRYRDQGPDWDYLAPFHGQHVFFYSLKAIDWIGASFGYSAYVRGGLFVFVRKDFVRGHAMLRLMRGPVIKAVECAMPLFSSQWPVRDSETVKKRRGVSKPAALAPRPDPALPGTPALSKDWPADART